MALLNVVKPEEATGEVAKVYENFMNRMGVIPRPFQMNTVSPGMMNLTLNSLGYFMNHPHLSFELLAHIRWLVASANGFAYCTNFNSGMLMKAAGYSRDQIITTGDNPALAELEDKEKALLVFVLKAVKTPEAVEAADVQGLRDMGWTDGDILDATAHGAQMVAGGILFNAFKMDQD